MSFSSDGIAGYFGPGDEALLRALSAALSHRGPGEELHTGAGFGLVARAERPEIAVADGRAAVAVGDAAKGVLESDGVTGTGAWALAGDGALLLARSGAQPIYYAQHGDLVVFASEPGALLAAGVVEPAADLATVRQYVLTGRVADGGATFLAGVRAVAVGRALTFRAGAVEELPLSTSEANRSLPEAVEAAAAQRPAVRLGEGLPGAVLAALVPEPAAIISASFRPMDTTEDAYVESVLPLVAPGAKHHVVEANTDTLVADLPGLLAALAEPFPTLDTYAQFVAAREAAAIGADLLLDPAGAGLPLPAGKNTRRSVDPATLLRITTEPDAADGPSAQPALADRVGAYAGVRIATPLAGLGSTASDLAALLGEDARATAGGARPAVPVRDWMLRLKNRIYGIFLEETFVNRGWFDQQAVMVAFEDFIKGRNADAELFWRIWSTEMWAREVLDPKPVADAEPPRIKGPLEPNANKQLPITVDGEEWLRFPIRTDLFLNGAPYQEQIAGYVRDFVTHALADERHAASFERPWYVLVSEKIVAISQGRSYFIWDIEPGWWARALQRFVVRTPYGIGLGSPWTMELAIREAGLPRILAASAVSAAGKLVGKRGLFYHVVGPAVRSIDGPTEYSVFPANVSAKLGPAKPHQVAAELTRRVRAELAEHGLAPGSTLAGVCVIDANDIGRNVLGLDADRPARFFEELFGDNPLGQGSEQTPVAVAVRA